MEALERMIVALVVVCCDLPHILEVVPHWILNQTMERMIVVLVVDHHLF